MASGVLPVLYIPRRDWQPEPGKPMAKYRPVFPHRSPRAPRSRTQHHARRDTTGTPVAAAAGLFPKRAAVCDGGPKFSPDLAASRNFPVPRAAPDAAAAARLRQRLGPPEQVYPGRRSVRLLRVAEVVRKLLERHARNHRRHGTRGAVSSSTIFRGSPGISPKQTALDRDCGKTRGMRRPMRCVSRETVGCRVDRLMRAA
jgi:hypothetical protein